MENGDTKQEKYSNHPNAKDAKTIVIIIIVEQRSNKNAKHQAFKSQS